MVYEGYLRKMKARLGAIVEYELNFADQSVPLNSYLGKKVRLSFLGSIRCVNCDKLTKKSWQQGYCFPCTQKLAECDQCILRPEKCHYALGTCREPSWGEAHCLRPHIVYLANSSGAKVGITREAQVPTRWIDQGAAEALALFRVHTRLDSGKLEVLLAEHVNDKTNWQQMLKGEPAALDLVELGQELKTKIASGLGEIKAEELVSQQIKINYPVLQYPEKVKSLNFEKSPVIEGTLLGIKGQYLMLETGVINLRNQSGYHVRWEEI